MFDLEPYQRAVLERGPAAGSVQLVHAPRQAGYRAARQQQLIEAAAAAIARGERVVISSPDKRLADELYERARALAATLTA